MPLGSGTYVDIGLHIPFFFFPFQNYSVFYEDWSFMMDEERSSMIPTMAAGKTFSSMLLLLENEFVLRCSWLWGASLTRSLLMGRTCGRCAFRVNSQGVMPFYATDWWTVKALDLAFLQFKNPSRYFSNSSPIKAKLKKKNLANLEETNGLFLSRREQW